MQILKDIQDIKFNKQDVFGTEMVVSEPIVMASAAGWYVGKVCKDPDCGGMVVPYDRYTGYYASSEEACEALDSFYYADM